MADGGVLFVAGANLSDEEEAAWQWLVSNRHIRARRAGPEQLNEELADTRILWWHAARPSTVPDISNWDLKALMEWLCAGGSVWLTLHAATLLSELGLEDRSPDEFGWSKWRHSETELEALEGERRGVIGFGPHPLFDGLAGGAMLRQPREGKVYPSAVYSSPIRGRVVAAEWQYLAVEPNRRIVLEQEAGAGRVLTVGAHLLFGEIANPFRATLERFARNCLRYLSEPVGEPRSYWPTVEFTPASAELGDIARAGKGYASLAEPSIVDRQRALVSDGAGDWQFDLAGRHIVLVGRERTGVKEIWSLPLRLARNVMARFDGVAEADALREFRRLPESVQRIFETPNATVMQSVSAANDAVLLFNPMAGELQRLELEFDVDLRYFWPYPEGVLGQPRLERSADELHLLDSENALRGSIRFEPWPDQLEGRPALGAAPVRATWERPQAVRVAFRGASPAPPAANPAEPALEIETPDSDFNEDVFWAINGLRSFDVETPAGRGLVAGFAETGTGWWSGRLGYAWFFGRDTVWSSLACLGIGMWDGVRESLRLQARYQSPEGKIFHELTPAGIGHFDAADSTPLFMVGLERYARWTGDVELLRELWPAARKALEFCFATDRDRDGLIENTGVGHGWSEGGPVYGAHATFYLNACWAAALESLAAAAGWLGESGLATRCRTEFERVKRLLNERFYMPAGWFAYGVASDGSLMPAETIEPAVGALFELLEPGRMGHFLDRVDSARFSTGWGVRYIANDDPAYHPKGYHHGSVWPLFTGWVAAAEYAYGRADAGFRHLRSSLALVRHRNLGAIDEALDGDTGEAVGVCQHQLWSHAMTVLPVIQGTLGVRPHAVGKRLILRPQLSANWPVVRVRNLRVGEHSLAFSYERRPAGLQLVMESQPADLDVEFEPHA